MRTLSIIAVFAVFVSGCLPKVDYPDEPRIEYLGFIPGNSVNIADSVGVVQISFTDGNGDLGLEAGDTNGVFHEDSTYYFNLFVNYYEKKEGVFELITPVFPNHVRFPNLTPAGNDKALEGEMNIGVFADFTSPYDTVKWEVYLVDRSLNHSNTISTQEIVLDK